MKSTIKIDKVAVKHIEALIGFIDRAYNGDSLLCSVENITLLIAKAKKDSQNCFELIGEEVRVNFIVTNNEIEWIEVFPLEVEPEWIMSREEIEEGVCNE